MASRSFLLDDDLWRYIIDHSLGVDPILTRLTERTLDLGGASAMQIGPDQQAFLTMLASFARVTSAVEVGTFTGTSALCLARGLTEGGRLICCDISEEWTAIAREAWVEAGVDDRIDLRIGPAAETLAALPSDAEIDLAFIDADKGGYIAYFDELVPRLRPGGWIVADNTLWGGRITDTGSDDADTRALRAYNAHAIADDRVRTVLLAVADGLTISQKR